MIRRPLRSALLVGLLFGPAARADDVYVWTDSQGETHYTNDVASIPEKSRRTVRKLEGDTSSLVEPRTSTPKAEEGKPAGEDGEKRAQADPQAPPPAPIEETLHAPREDETVNEDQWRSMFRKANEKVKRAERKAQRTREALAKLPGQDLTSYDYAGNVVVDSRYQSLKVQLEEDEYQLATAREELHDLERAAARDAVPLEWRR